MKTLALLAVVMIAGCDVEDASPIDAGAPAAAPTGLDAGLARASLQGSSLAKQQLIATEAGRAALTQLVSCALPAGASVTGVATDGTPYQFAGSLGLAPAWADRAPSAIERRRVASCLHNPTAPAPDTRPMIGTLASAQRRG